MRLSGLNLPALSTFLPVHQLFTSLQNIHRLTMLLWVSLTSGPPQPSVRLSALQLRKIRAPRGLKWGLEIREERKDCISVCAALWGRERRRLHADCIFGSALKTKNRRPAEPSHDGKIPLSQLKLDLCSWCARLWQMHWDGDKKTNKNSFPFLTFKCFYKWRRLFCKQPWESVSTSHRSCHAEYYEQGVKSTPFCFF